jgi:hypothetical protein
MGDNPTTSDSSDEQADAARLSTDGGDTERRETEQSHLQSVFVRVTGVEECIDRQQETGMSRYVDADTTSVLAAASAVADDDGLTDTIDEVRSSDEME